MSPHQYLLANVRLQERYGLTEALRKMAIDAAESLINRRQKSNLYGGNGEYVDMTDAEVEAWFEQYTLENVPVSVLRTINAERAVVVS